MTGVLGTTAVIGVMIPIVAMVIGLIIVIYVVNNNYRIKLLQHQQQMKAIEQGIALPAEPEKPKPVYPFTWPFVFLGFGLALILLYVFDHHADFETLGFGLVIFFVGAGLFASRFYGVKREKLDSQLNSIASSASPKSKS